jgi:hypothetical protein
VHGQRQKTFQSYNEPYKNSGNLLSGCCITLDLTKWKQNRDASLAAAETSAASAEVDELIPSEHEDDADVDPDEKKTKSRKRKRESDVASAKGWKGTTKEQEPKRKSVGAGAGRRNNVKAYGGEWG